MATGGLNPQHLVVAGSEAATQISQALHPTDPQASMTPITPLTSQQQHQMDAMELQGNQSMAMQMKVAAMKQQMDMTSSLVDVAEKGTANIGKAASGGS